MNQTEIDALISGNWEIDCRVIELISRNPDRPEVYRGPGWIRQEEASEFRFKMLVTEPTLPDLEHIFRLGPGRVVPPEDYYVLRAYDEIGRVWEIDGVYPNEMAQQLTSFSLTGVASYLECSGPLNISAEARVEMLFPGRLRIPGTTFSESVTTVDGEVCERSGGSHVAKFHVAGCEVYLMAEDDSLRIEIKPLGDMQGIPPYIDEALVEALQFSLAQRMQPVYIARTSARARCVRVKPRPQTVVSRRFPPLLVFGPRDESGFFWELCRKYLEYVLRSRADRTWHPISETLLQIFLAAEGPIETHGLVLSLGVEAVLRSEFPNVGKPAPGLLQAIREARRGIKSKVADRGFRDRILNIVGNLKNASALGKLRALERAGLITIEQRESWTRLRNRAAHPNAGATPLSEQELLDLIKVVTMLMHHLICVSIGYEGELSDWSGGKTRDAMRVDRGTNQLPRESGD